MPSFLRSSETVVLGPPLGTKETKKAQQVRERLRKLEAEWKEQELKVDSDWQRKGDDVTDLLLAPRKSDVQVTRFGLAWAPFWRVALPGGTTELRAAYRQ